MLQLPANKPASRSEAEGRPNRQAHQPAVASGAEGARPRCCAPGGAGRRANLPGVAAAVAAERQRSLEAEQTKGQEPAERHRAGPRRHCRHRHRRHSHPRHRGRRRRARPRWRPVSRTQSRSREEVSLVASREGRKPADDSRLPPPRRAWARGWGRDGDGAGRGGARPPGRAGGAGGARPQHRPARGGPGGARGRQGPGSGEQPPAAPSGPAGWASAAGAARQPAKGRLTRGQWHRGIIHEVSTAGQELRLMRGQRHPSTKRRVVQSPLGTIRAGESGISSYPWGQNLVSE